MLIPNSAKFHWIVWDKLAEMCHQFLHKGRKVFVEGRLQSHTYTGQNGRERKRAPKRFLKIWCLLIVYLRR
ncbi:MAG TPA: single-stranded DNA-binding protein [Dehalococcoidia bacterium]|nr:single-stranded DNA-binding protein [Dehalococcoidia bacterium]